jgi:hypothetical protein
LGQKKYKSKPIGPKSKKVQKGWLVPLDQEESKAWIRILLELDKKPARSKQLEDVLVLHHSTVMYALRYSLLAKNGIIIQLPDGRYALKWYNSAAEAIQMRYQNFREKLLRNPSPEEFAGIIEKTPDEARELLYKHIRGYCEPTSEEIAAARNILFKKIVYGSWLENELPTSKKALYEKGTHIIKADGLDSDTLDEILKNICSVSQEDTENYLKKYPDMKFTVNFKSKDEILHFKIIWSEEAKEALHGTHPWDQVAVARIPLKLDSLRIMSAYGEYEWLDNLIAISDNYVPSKKVIDRLLNLLGLPHRENDVLIALKKFCQNALDVGQLDDEIKFEIISELMEIAFSQDLLEKRNYEHKSTDESLERNSAFEIIELLNFRTEDLIQQAKDNVFARLIYSEELDIKGPQILRAAGWLARDPDLKTELIREIKRILRTTDVFLDNFKFLDELLDFLTKF